MSNPKTHRVFTWILALVCVGVIATGCSSDDGNNNGGTPDIGASDTGGNLDIGGRDGGVVPDTTIPVPDTGVVPTDNGVTPTPDTGVTPTPDTGVTPTPDTGVTPTPDTGPKPDSAAPPDPSPLAGQIVVTEFMANPFAVADGNGEYVEIHNTSSTQVDLKDWTLKDDGSDSHKIATSVTIDPGQYVVLGPDDVTSTNGGLTVAYKYSDFFLGQAGDEIVLLDADGKLVDKVAYAKGVVVAGFSHQLTDPALDNADMTNWCLAGPPWSGSAGDSGTPGAATVCAAVTDGGAPDSAASDAGAPDA